MKTKMIFLAVPALVSFLAAPAWSQAVMETAALPNAPLFGQPIKASEIIGCSLKNFQGQKMGVVKDLAIDVENGRIVEVIVARGGFLGSGQKLVAVTPDNFPESPVDGTLRVNLDREKLLRAPAVEISQWADAMTSTRVQEVYHYFGSEPYFLVPAQQSRDFNHPVMHPLGAVARGSHLMGITLLNRQNDTLGKVANFIVDLSAGRVVEVIFNSGRYLGMPDELSAVPPQALSFLPQREILVLDTSKEALRDAPHFHAHGWFSPDRAQITEVYQAYHVLPYFLPVGLDAFTQNSRSDQKPVAPSKENVSPADIAITAEIRKNLQAADDLPADARNVRILTLNGHVTLKGQVADERQKRRVGEIAARTVSVADVDNQIEVKGSVISALD